MTRYIRQTALSLGDTVGWGTLVKHVAGGHGVKATYTLRCSCCGSLHSGQAEILARARQQHRLGLTCSRCRPEETKRHPIKVCPICHDLPHRRPPDGCPRCGEPHEPDVIEKRYDNRDGEAWAW